MTLTSKELFEIIISILLFILMISLFFVSLLIVNATINMSDLR